MAKGKGCVEVLARGVFVRRGQLLLCHGKGADITYLPGGHVEFEEDAQIALRREIEEETGLQITVGGFLGVAEHVFLQKGRRHCEVNFVFAMHAAGANTTRPPASHEKHIEFLWCPLTELGASCLEPAVLREALPGWLEAGPVADRWQSTYSRRNFR